MNLGTVQSLHGLQRCVNIFFTRKLNISAKPLQVVKPLLIEVYIVAVANGTGLVRVHIYAPKKLTGHIGFRLSVCTCVRACILPCMLEFHIWIPHGKIADILFFLVRVVSLSGVMPFEKIRMKSDACHILLTVHTRVLKFHVWIPHGNIADIRFFFLLRDSSLSGVMPF